jgi:serine/threonine protein kinase
VTLKIAPGETIDGRYRLVDVLGEGGMGVVWAATDTRNGDSVALKFVKGAATQADQRRRFLREARAASAVDHPNVVRILDVLELEDDTPAIVMELLEGESLAARLDRDHRIPLADLARILLPVVSAVGTAHALGIVHRDLKPENIFLSRKRGSELEVKVLDFGIAKLTALEGAAAQTTGATTTGALLGTPCYMSPEQACGEKDIDHRTDIWSMGMILYECLSGILPTRADNVGQVMKLLLMRPIPRLDDIDPDIPAPVASMVERMLARPRAERPHDLREVQAMLETHAGMRAPTFGPVRVSGRPDDDTVEPSPHADTVALGDSGSAPRAFASSAAKRSKARGARGWIAGAALAAVGLAGWWATRHEGDPEPTADATNVTPTPDDSAVPSSQAPGPDAVVTPGESSVPDGSLPSTESARAAETAAPAAPASAAATQRPRPRAVASRTPATAAPADPDLSARPAAAAPPKPSGTLQGAVVGQPPF